MTPRLWAAPAAVALLIAFALGGYLYLVSTSAPAPLAARFHLLALGDGLVELGQTIAEPSKPRPRT